MIAATIGRTFLKAYNEKYYKQMTAKQFFIEEFVPLFYGGSKYMQWITNSPFVQGLSSDPKGEYGVREKIKGADGKSMLFSSDSEAVKHFKEKIQTRSDFLFGLLPKYNITNKAIDYLSSLTLDKINGFKNIIIDSQFKFNIYCEKNEEGKWKFSEIGIKEIRNKKFNSKEEILEFFAEEIVSIKGYFQLKDNKKISAKGIEFIKTLNNNERKKLLNDFILKAEKAASSNQFDGSIAIGFPASENEKFQVASGQVSDINIGYSEDDIYLSWIGNGFAIGVAGGFSIFFNTESILLSLYEGWKAYREILDDSTINIVGNQIDTWNGQWIAFKNSRYYSEDYDYLAFDQYKFFKIENNKIKVDTIFWSKVLFELSNHYHSQKITGNVFTYGDTNKTLGFYPFQFESATTIKGYYKKLFGEQEAIKQAKDYEALFGLHIKTACKIGSFGLQALEPSTLRDKYGNFKELKLAKPKPQKDKEKNKKAQEKDYENIIKFRTYKTWLIAMITKNKEENLNYTEEVAKVLFAHKQEARVEKKQIEEKLFKAKGRKQFMIELNELLKIVSSEKTKVLKDLSERVYLLNDEDFQYLFILIKIEFTYQERLANQ